MTLRCKKLEKHFNRRPPLNWPPIGHLSNIEGPRGPSTGFYGSISSLKALCSENTERKMLIPYKKSPALHRLDGDQKYWLDSEWVGGVVQYKIGAFPKDQTCEPRTRNFSFERTKIFNTTTRPHHTTRHDHTTRPESETKPKQNGI